MFSPPLVLQDPWNVKQKRSKGSRFKYVHMTDHQGCGPTPFPPSFLFSFFFFLLSLSVPLRSTGKISDEHERKGLNHDEQMRSRGATYTSHS